MNFLLDMGFIGFSNLFAALLQVPLAIFTDVMVSLLTSQT